ncbi:T9SS type A sorting domain-containing protein [Phaeodactylibacter xiamenensis]|uniref:T9SS type A sorting domain-containing protein n=1 Tax=Phaeodactylibacter xiamenensis TaxID=1524460 RepID=UPI003CCC0687
MLSTPLLGSELNPSLNSASDCPAEAAQVEAVEVGCIAGTLDLEATVIAEPVIPHHFEQIFLLASGANRTIIALNDQPQFTIDEAGEYSIHSLVYRPSSFNPNNISLGDLRVAELVLFFEQGGGVLCGALDTQGAGFHIGACPCDAEAGTLNAAGVCFDNNLAEIKSAPSGDAVIPAGFEIIYVLTSGNDLLIEGVNETPEFIVSTDKNYRIHPLVYDPSTLDLSIVEIGVTTGFEVNSLLLQGNGSICASLNVEGTQFNFGGCDACLANAGTLVADSDNCLDGAAELIASEDTAPNVPAGFEVLYVLTSGNGLVIQDVNDTPQFTVAETGLFTIHTLVYDPATLDLSIVEFGVTTGVDVNNLLIQGGGDICASLLVAGAQFQVEECPCTADAGTLTADSDNCLDGDAALVAAEDTAPNVPAGYEVIYVLTSGNGLVIQDVNATPEFTVTDTGLYTIHTLVYNPLTLDLSIVEFGVTTGVDVNNLLIQGGGDICASLLVAGAQFQVEACCTADAGTLVADSDNCLDGEAELIASEDTAPNVPAGFEVLYVLTSGNGLVIQDVNDTPQFTVAETGLFTIHTLVYDPATLDLSIVEFGVTTGVDVNNLLIQGGGDICASLLVAGAQFQVEECPCTADAGTLTADSDNCLDGDAALVATEDTTPNVPAGYEVIYVLTSGNGLVIQDVNATPEFTVTDTGLYTIHTLVYNPLTLDLSIVEFGVTTGVDVNNLLIQGGGDICASLLVAGAQFQVEECPCTAEAGTLIADSDNCLDGTAELTAVEGQAPVIPNGYERLFVLTSGTDLVIEAVNTDPTFTIEETGLFTIHTLIYNPLTLDLSIVEFGVTTGVDVNGLLVQGGGDICAALDVAGAAFQVEPCPTLLEKAPYPNPVSDQLYVPVADWMIGSDLTIHLNDANGKLVREIKVEEANALEVIDMRQMTPGGYTLVVYHSDGTRGMVRRIIKM